MTKFYFLKSIILILLPLASYSQAVNIELQKMHDEDQSSRFETNIDWTILVKQDSLRELRVYELMKTGQIVTGKDYFNSAMICQHGRDTIASAYAVQFMRKALELDSTVNRWLLAAAIDRDLQRRGKPQIYGTQFGSGPPYGTKVGTWVRYKIDTTEVTAEERKYYGVQTLAKQLEYERILNMKSILKFYSESKSLHKSVNLIKSEKKKGYNATYLITPDEINTFGYALVAEKKLNDALEIFILNTKIYPNNANAFDSLGECLLLIGRKEEGINAYKKSLELNSKNKNANEIINGTK